LLGLRPFPAEALLPNFRVGDNPPANPSSGEKIMSVMKFRYSASIASAVMLFATLTAMAKRIPPKPVPPVESNGVRYAADGVGSDQYVAATDISTGKQLWRVRVFHTRIKPWLEPDVQIVVIAELKVVGGSLFVRDEKSRCYTVGIADRRVRKTACSAAFAEHDTH
jgi:hypothetical protein